jgi:hypothetical protein
MRSCALKGTDRVHKTLGCCSNLDLSMGMQRAMFGIGSITGPQHPMGNQKLTKNRRLCDSSCGENLIDSIA